MVEFEFFDCAFSRSRFALQSCVGYASGLHVAFSDLVSLYGEADMVPCCAIHQFCFSQLLCLPGWSSRSSGSPLTRCIFLMVLTCFPPRLLTPVVLIAKNLATAALQVNCLAIECKQAHSPLACPVQCWDAASTCFTFIALRNGWRNPAPKDNAPCVAKNGFTAVEPQACEQRASRQVSSFFCSRSDVVRIFSRI